MTRPPLDIARLLPPAMRAQFVAGGFPVWRLAAWVLLAAALVLVPAAGPPRAIEPSGPTFSAQVTVGLTDTFMIGESGGVPALSVGGATRTIATTEGKMILADANGRPWTLEKSDDGIGVTHPDVLGYLVKVKDEEGWSVRGADGSVLFKVKRKDDKFNVYDGHDVRLRHGKEKKGSIVVRDEQDSELLRIEGASLADAAIVALPVPVEVRALLWQERAALH